MTRRTANLVLAPSEHVDVSPDDAARFGVGDGDRVEIASRRGRVSVAVRVTDDVAPGELFLAFHFPEVAANLLTSDGVDEVTACPEYKVTAVRMSRAHVG
jgi:formate dehydrogenase major subunit